MSNFFHMKKDNMWDRKGVLGVLMLIGLCIFSINVSIHPVEASLNTYVYIRPDGRVDPSIVPIQRVGNVYTLTENIYASIIVQKDNLVIDGVGHVVQGKVDLRLGDSGVNLHGRSNVTVKNIEIKQFASGISLNSAHDNIIYHNKIIANEHGIVVEDSAENSLIDNTITANNIGIEIGSSTNLIVTGNLLNENIDGGFAIAGSELKYFLHSIDSSNLVDGKPVYYLINQTDLTIKPDTHSQVGFLALINCSKITFQDLTIIGNTPSLLMAYTDNSEIMRNNLTNSLQLFRSSNNIVVENNITGSLSLRHSSNNVLNGNTAKGILLYSSSHNIISRNLVSESNNGIYLREDSNNNTVSGNTLIKNYYGIMITKSSDNNLSGNLVLGGGRARSYYPTGIYVGPDSTNTRILRNNVTNNNRGILLREGTNNSVISENYISKNYEFGIAIDSINNTVCMNTITGNYKGLHINPFNNTLYLNNFLGNNTKISIGISSKAIWDNGFEGNYWSDYEGTDSNGDGIGDTPYIIDENNQDNLPLMNPWIPPNQKSEPFPITWILVIIGIIAIVGVAILVWFSKIKGNKNSKEIGK